VSPKPYYMYVLSCKDGSFYCGVTTDPDRREKEHNGSKRGAKYTRSRRPVKLIFSMLCKSKSDAYKKEAAFKKLTRSQKLEYMCDVIEKDILEKHNNVRKMQNANADIDQNSKPDNNSSK